MKFKELDFKVFKDMLNYSLPMIPNSISWWVSNSSDKYILTLFCGVSVTGLYSVSQRIPSLFAQISTIFMGAWQISAVEDFGSEFSRRFYSTIYKKYSSLNIILVSILITFTVLIAKILFSNDFFEAWIFVPILLLAFLFNSLNGFLGTIYTSAKKTKMLFLSTVVAALTNIVLNFLLIPFFGGQGAAFATFISYMLIWLIRLIDTRKIMILDINLKKDVFSYVLLILQIIFVLASFRFKWFFVIGLMLFIIGLHIEIFFEMISIFKRVILKRGK